jgi:hypothetical protein
MTSNTDMFSQISVIVAALVLSVYGIAFLANAANIL